MPTLVDDFIPRPHAAERHSIVINASRDRVWQALTHLNPQDIRLAKPLFAVRRLFSRSSGDRQKQDAPTFTPLAVDPMREIVLGTIGQWWRLGRAEHTPAIGDADDFRAFDRPGYAKGTFSFLLDDAGPGRIRLVTETRVLATSPDARRAFRRYWIFIRLGSGLIRRIILAAVRARS
ncbi:hypothetical protein [Nonomuraea sp. NEAU-A123]|uniref:hypothetical protein n=1 Tax=Nonomuraea sp. NEAU-A123 TaxID=2839649 RepID=UPI001BE482BA|nr:hypothetical protein [Nonomuraea sp. NEAU-A123]MBT2235415.1 hypothetical protein [Nonomuraea sp. NEAU-A123]